VHVELDPKHVPVRTPVRLSGVGCTTDAVRFPGRSTGCFVCCPRVKADFRYEHIVSARPCRLVLEENNFVSAGFSGHNCALLWPELVVLTTETTLFLRAATTKTAHYLRKQLAWLTPRTASFVRDLATGTVRYLWQKLAPRVASSLVATMAIIIMEPSLAILGELIFLPFIPFRFLFPYPSLSPVSTFIPGAFSCFDI
jgi:hypothetical protein